MTVEHSNPPSAATQEASAEAPASTEFAGQFVSLRVLFGAVRRSYRMWMTLMAVGLVAGLGLGYVKTPANSATTKLLLSHAGQVSSADAMSTDVALLQTEEVAQQVINRLHLHQSVQSFLSQYTATSLSTQIAVITVSAPSGSEAVHRANALASVFLTFRAEQYNRQNQAAVSALDTQQQSLTAEINQLTTEIAQAPSGSASAAGTASLATLQSEQNQAIAQQAQIEQDIQSDNLNTTTEIQASSVLAPAVVNPHSHVRKLLTDALLGLLVGGGVGIVVVVLWAAVTDRVRRREDFVDALGAPVELNLAPFHRPRIDAVRRLRRRVDRPRDDTVVLARHLRAKMGGSQSSLAVVPIDSVEAASLAVAYCAHELTREGREVLVVDLSSDGLLSRILGLRGGPRPASPDDNGKSAVRVYGPSADGWSEASAPRGGFVLVLATLDPVLGAEHLLPWAHQAVAVVTAGRSRPDKVRANAELLRAAGLRLDSAVLVGADPDDYSLGRRSWTTWPMSDHRLRDLSAEPVKSWHQS